MFTTKDNEIEALAKSVGVLKLRVLDDVTWPDDDVDEKKFDINWALAA